MSDNALSYVTGYEITAQKLECSATLTRQPDTLDFNHQQFVDDFVNFLCFKNPSAFIPNLISELTVANRKELHSAEIGRTISRSVSCRAIAESSLKMRVFWLVGEIFSQENELSLGCLRTKLNVIELFYEFLSLENGQVC